MVATAIAAIGVAVSSYGLYSSEKSASQQNRNNKNRTATLNPLFDKQDALNQEVVSANKRLEQIRMEQAKQDANRSKRQILRESQVARSTALSRATNQGAAGSTALQGAYGQITGQTSDLLNTLNQNANAGQAVFAENQNIFDLQSKLAAAQGQINRINSTSTNVQDFGRSLMQGGSLLTQNADTFGKVYNSVFTPTKTA
jgi:chromosome segregation ATPase